MPTVLNYRTSGFPDGSVSIMRATPWGNPYTHLPYVAASGRAILVPTREDAVRMFRVYLDANPALVAQARRALYGKDLVCCCVPLACHGWVWLELATVEGVP